jgi:carboxyl-terminal processing protease
VVVYIGRDGIAQPIPFEIERDEVHIAAVRYERIFDDISYVVLDRVTRNSAAEVDSVLTELGTTQGIVFDLRRNPGGYLDEALNLADLFLDRGSVLVTTKSRTRGSSDLREESARARMTPRVTDLPIVILVDQYSASAAEIVAGALQDHDRALVIGERTFGKGLVQSVIPLPEGRLIRITSGEWYTPQGRSLHRPRDEDGVVIEPDSIPEFVSIGGRRLLGGGGVFPDLEILSDTLSSGEQAFLNAAIEEEFPLQTRIQEAAFSAATGARDAGDGKELVFPVEILDDLFAAISEVEVLDPLLTEEAKAYIAWRMEVVFHQRLGQVDRGLEVQTERDTVLQTAVRFLQRAEDQTALFALAQAEKEARAQAGAEEVELGSVPQ